MRLIIAGTRRGNVTLDDVAQALIDLGLSPKEIVSGGSGTVDGAGEEYARNVGLPKRIFVAQWSTYGKWAGPKRNQDMAEYADELLAFWDGKSRGTSNMIDEMRVLGKKVHIVRI